MYNSSIVMRDNDNMPTNEIENMIKAKFKIN